MGKGQVSHKLCVALSSLYSDTNQNNLHLLGGAACPSEGKGCFNIFHS